MSDSSKSEIKIVMYDEKRAGFREALLIIGYKRSLELVEVYEPEVVNVKNDGQGRKGR